MKASARLRKAAADKTIEIVRNYYYIDMKEKYDADEIRKRNPDAECIACAIGAMVACCSPRPMIEDLYHREDTFYRVVKLLAPELMQREKQIPCPFSHEKGDGKPERGEYDYDELMMEYKDLTTIANFVEHLFEDHRITDLNEIADIIEPMGY